MGFGLLAAAGLSSLRLFQPGEGRQGGLYDLGRPLRTAGNGGGAGLNVCQEEQSVVAVRHAKEGSGGNSRWSQRQGQDWQSQVGGYVFEAMAYLE